MGTVFTVAGIAVKWWQLTAGMFLIVGIFGASELDTWPLFHSGGSHYNSAQMCGPQ